MIGRLILCLSFVLATGAAYAQEPACTLYKVNTSLLNISQDAGGGVYIDVLEDGEIACVTKEQKAAGGDWVFIAHKQNAAKTPVNGWSAVSFLTKLSPAEAAALGGAAAARTSCCCRRAACFGCTTGRRCGTAGRGASTGCRSCAACDTGTIR